MLSATVVAAARISNPPPTITELIERWYEDLRQHDQWARFAVNLATGVGLIWLIVFALKFAYLTLEGFSMYVWAQLVRPDLKKKYGRWVVISGATDGIGLGFAKDLAARGHSLIIMGRDDEKLASVKTQLTEISTSTDEIVTVKLDLAVATLFDYIRVVREMQIDQREIGILINNAGMFPGYIRRSLKHDIKDMETMINVNIKAALILTRLIVPTMIKNGRGLVMNISSQFGELSAPYFGIYGPTKHFISEFSRILQIEYSGFPIDIVNYNTGPVFTKLVRGWTDQVSRPNVMNPHPDTYARSALACASGISKETTGYWFHGFLRLNCLFVHLIGLWPALMRFQVKVVGRHTQLSPSPGRKMKPPTEQSDPPIDGGEIVDD